MSITNTNVVAKVAAVVAGLGLVAMSFASFAVPARAATADELAAQIAALQAQLATLGGSSSASVTFTRDLTIGSTGADVTALQNWLIKGGFAIPAGATGYFGAQTAAALGKYQASVMISPAAGYFGPITRAKVNAVAGGSTGGNTGGSTGLQGGAGDIESAEFVSGLNNEEVGEDEEDVEVAGLDIEADDGSDIEITSVRLIFDESTGATGDFDEYASEVSIWLDGEEVGREDASEFNDDNDWTKSVSLDDAVIEAGETAELTVAISGVSNLDSADVNDEWDVAFDSVRFMDADGASITEDSIDDIGDTDTREFSFTTFASAADAELTIKTTTGDDADEINDAHVIDIDDSDDTDNVDILAFTAEVEGDSDLTVDDLTFVFTSTGADVEELVFEARLMMGDEVVGSEDFASTATTTSTLTFDDLDLTLDADSETEFTIQVDLASETDTNVDNGDTISVSLPEAQLDAADIEDESGEDLPTGDRGGSATGEAHGLYEKGIMVEFVSASETVTSPDTGADRGTFKIEFDVTAFDTDAYVDSTAIANEGDGATFQNIAVTGTSAESGVIESTSGATAGTDGFLVEEDETERFMVTVNVTPASDGFYAVNLVSVLYALTDIDGNVVYAFDMTDYKTDSVYLDTNA